MAGVKGRIFENGKCIPERAVCLHTSVVTHLLVHE